MAAAKFSKPKAIIRSRGRKPIQIDLYRIGTPPPRKRRRGFHGLRDAGPMELEFRANGKSLNAIGAMFKNATEFTIAFPSFGLSSRAIIERLSQIAGGKDAPNATMSIYPLQAVPLP